MSRKVLLFIVEGPSDEAALGLILSRLCDSSEVNFKVIHGDITTRDGISSDNIIKNVVKIVKNWAENNHILAQDFQEVIHLVDLDGTYVDDSCIVEDSAAENVIYTETEIYYKSSDDIRKRNLKKGENIYRLRSTSKIWRRIPYHAYYMSSSLDHVLHNKLNSTDQEKEDDANKFSQKYKDRLDDFLGFMCDSDFAVTSDYKNSWDFIEKDNRSLKRYTNLSGWLKLFQTKRNDVNVNEKVGPCCEKYSCQDQN